MHQSSSNANIGRFVGPVLNLLHEGLDVQEAVVELVARWQLLLSNENLLSQEILEMELGTPQKFQFRIRFRIFDVLISQRNCLCLCLPLRSRRFDLTEAVIRSCRVSLLNLLLILTYARDWLKLLWIE